ncbi:hypothetical protein HKD37_08G022610 [Glycine soja]
MHFLPATASKFVYGSKKYITLHRGLGKRTQRQVTIHDGVPSIADPWFQYLDQKKLMAEDEVFLPATASRFVCGSKKYVTLQRGLGKCTQWQYLHEKKLMAEDEFVFYFRFDDHAWELLIRKDIEWDKEDIHLDD